MARYTGPKSRIARKFGEGIFGADKVLSKKNYPPGQHGNSRKRKTSEYGVQLREKLEQIRFCLRRIILLDSTEIREREKLQSMVCNFARSRKLNILMEFWKNNSAICLRRQLR